MNAINFSFIAKLSCYLYMVQVKVLANSMTCLDKVDFCNCSIEKLEKGEKEKVEGEHQRIQEVLDAQLSISCLCLPCTVGQKNHYKIDLFTKKTLKLQVFRV